MARLFTAASNEFAKNANAVVTATPLTMMCWVRLTAVGTVVRIIMEIRNSASPTGRNCWGIRMRDTEIPRAIAASASAAVTVDGLSALVAGTWTHLAGVFTDATHYAIWTNGVESAQVSASTVPTGVNVTDIGIAEVDSGSLSLPWNGDIAFPAFYNVALVAADIQAAAKAFGPPFVRPDALVSAPPFDGNASPEPDPFGGFDFTLTGTSKSANPRIIHPSRPWMRSVPAVAGGLSIPVAMHQYRRLRAA